MVLSNIILGNSTVSILDQLPQILAACNVIFNSSYPGPITMTETVQDFVNTSIMCPSTTNKNIN